MINAVKNVGTLLFEETKAAMKRLTSEEIVEKAAKLGAVDAHEVKISQFLQFGKGRLDPTQKLYYDEVAIVDKAKTSVYGLRDILTRLRRLGVESLRNLNSREREQIDVDYQYLKKSYQHMASETSYRDIPILNANPEDLAVKVRSQGLGLLGMDRYFMDPLAELITHDDDEEVFVHNVKTRADAAMSLQVIDHALASLTELEGGLRGVDNRMVELVHNIDARTIESDVIKDRYAMSSVAHETVNQILDNASRSLLASTAGPLTGLSMLLDY